MRSQRRGHLATRWVLLALWPALAATAQEATVAASAPLAADAPMPLTSAAKSTLSAIQDNWLQWDSAFQRGEEGSAGMAIDDLLQTAGELGMSRLPEVCSAVLARATISAADGGTPRARWALDMAERLDPGRPEVEFARAAVARHEGRYAAMVWSELVGYTRLASVPLFWRLTRRESADLGDCRRGRRGRALRRAAARRSRPVADRRHRRDREQEAPDHDRLSGRARGLHPAGAGARGVGGAAALLGDPVAALCAALGARGDRDRRRRADRDAVPARARRPDASPSSCRRRWTPRAVSRSAASMAA